jgi:hypothetical protein
VFDERVLGGFSAFVKSKNFGCKLKREFTREILDKELFEKK